MSIWAQIGDDRTTAIPPDGRTVIDVYANFTFSGDPVPDGTIIKFIAGKGDIEQANNVAEIEAAITPLNGVKLFETSSRVESKFVRDADGTLTLRSVATVRLQPVADILKDSVTIVAYSTYDKLGTASRLAFDVLTLTVSSGDGIFLKSVERYNPTGDSWENVASMLTGRSGIFSETVSGKIYAIGGFNGNFSSVCEEYDQSTDEWAAKSSMSIARGFGSSVVYSNEIYVIGGYTFDPGRSTTVFEKYNPSSDTWTTLTPLPFTLSFSTAIINGTDIWVFYGGIKFDETDKLATPNSGVLRYDILTDIWTIEDAVVSGATSTTLTAAASAGDFILTVPSGEAFPTTGFITLDRGTLTEETVRYSTYTNATFLLVDGLTYAHSSGTGTVDNAVLPSVRIAANSYFDGASVVKIFNGFDTEVNGELEEFDISTNTYSATAIEANVPRTKAGQGLIGTDLYIVGGSSADSDFSGSNESVDIASDTFTAGLAKMSIFRTSFGCTAANDGANDFVYAIGGQGCGHEAGWLKIDVETSPEKIRADGKETASIKVTATDASGDAVPDGIKFNVRGLLFINKTQSALVNTETTTDRTPPPSVSILPVLFSSQEMFTVDGEAATLLLDRSEDFVNEVQNLLNFVKGDEKVLNSDTLKKDAKKFANQSIKIGEDRDLYNVAVEVSVEDDFYFGQTDSDAAAAEIADKPLSSETFSFNPPSASQSRSGNVGFYSDVASMPDVQRLTTSPTDIDTVSDIIDDLAEEIPFGASPHFDALVTGASYRIVDPPVSPLLPPTNIMVSASDNENSGSSSSAEDVVEEVNLVDGPQNFPVFITTVVVTDPLSLAARKARTDVADLELISSETGGNSFSLDSADYVTFIIDRIKTSAPSSIGSGSITATHEIEGSISTISFVVDNMIAGNTANLTAKYSIDGYTFYDLGIDIDADIGAGDVTTSYTLGTPVKATVVDYTVKMSSKTFDSPVLKSVTIEYIKPNVQYLFTYPQSVSGQVAELAAVTNERLPSGSTVEVGMVHGDSFEFERDFISTNQPAIQERGTIFSIQRDAPLINGVIFRDIMTSNDFRIYKSKSGPWAQDAIVSIFVNEQEALPSEFLSVPEDGKIVFRRQLASSDIVGIEVQNPANFKVGLRITNPTLSTGVLDSFAYMFGETEALGGLKPNRPPTATNLFITPSPVVPGGPIEANYTFVDPDGDEEDEDKTQIIWFRNGVPVPALNNKKSVSNQDLIAQRNDGGKDNLISRGQQWFFSVRPNDRIAYGPLAVSHTVTITNVPPTGSNVQIKSSNPNDPLKFTSADTITATFDFVDLDDDPSLNNVYIFYVNEFAVKTGTSNTLSPDEEDDAGNKLLGAGKTVRVEVIPSDGRDFGTKITSDSIVIQSSAAVITDVSLLPTKPSAASTLILSYNFVDVDKDRDQSRIAWFANDVRKTDFDNLKQIPRGNLKPGQKWYAIVTPFDGSVEGEPVKSNIVLVQD